MLKVVYLMVDCNGTCVVELFIGYWCARLAARVIVLLLLMYSRRERRHGHEHELRGCEGIIVGMMEAVVMLESVDGVAASR